MIVSKSVLISRFGLAIAKSNQAEALTLSPYSGPWLLRTVFRQNNLKFFFPRFTLPWFEDAIIKESHRFTVISPFLATCKQP